MSGLDDDSGHAPANGFSLDTSFGWSAIWVIESIPNGELRTGKELYEGTLQPWVWKNTRPESAPRIEYVPVEGEADFFDALDRIINDVRNTGRVPILHVECHGDENGLRLRNEDRVEYDKLTPRLRDLNRLTRHNLFVVMSACYGLHLMSIIKPTDRAPVWGLCGPPDKIPAGQLLDGYRAFYSVLLQGSGVNAARAAMNAAVPSLKEHSVFINAEYIFAWVFRHYLAEMCSEDAVSRRVADINLQVKARGLKPRAIDAGAAMARREMTDPASQKAIFEERKRNFFYADLYPENAERLNVSFEKMLSIRVREDA